MKAITGCAAQSLLLLVIAGLAAVPLACLATLTAPLHSPGYAGRVFCPAGSQLEGEWYQTTYNEPGERTLSVTCVDAQGNSVPANPRNETTLFNGIRLYFPVCFVPIVVLGALALVVVNGLIRVVRRKAGNPGQ
ncbi:MAG: hypothetical protein L0332_04220 [Chloroflexi bacterium]|nr:hypothetical protein [Chloroflexota bacterium]MCI0577769.1 hypothetical protein [Chloroflexota bacterium]MCI0643425.1 hypothetical protein [Chloroflexota bacterium]MCI0725916.1 hypothetical protein [Chloroflexota bacterium]